VATGPDALRYGRGASRVRGGAQLEAGITGGLRTAACARHLTSPKGARPERGVSRGGADPYPAHSRESAPVSLAFENLRSRAVVKSVASGSACTGCPAVDGPLSTVTGCRQRILALFISVIPALGATARAEPTAWQVQDGAITTIVEGDQALAFRTAMRLRQVEATARWMLDWQDGYHPPQALIFELQARTVRRVFTQPQGPNALSVDPNTAIGAAVSLPSISVVVAPVGPERSLQLVPLQGLYASLVPTFDRKLAAWPPCVRQGVEAMLSVASFEDNDHLYIDARRFAQSEVLNPEAHLGPTLVTDYGIPNPAEFLDPSAPPASRPEDANARSFACIVLTRWYLTAEAGTKRAFEQLFTAVGSGQPFADSIPQILGGTLAEFTARFRRYGAQWRFRPEDFDVRAVLPNLAAPSADPIVVPPERFEAFLRQICSKLSRCRS
jgi:hypothetical protein